jgi:hypothetical protein
MDCRSEAAQANGKTRCWRAPPAADAETFSRTRPRISDTVQPQRGPRSDLSDRRRAATQPRSLASRAGRGAVVGFGTAPGNQARTTPLARECARESPSNPGTRRHSPPSAGRVKACDSSGFEPANPVVAVALGNPISRALGALGRRFESCRPDSSHTKGPRRRRGPSFLAKNGQCTENVRMTGSEGGSRGAVWAVVRAMYERRLSARERVLHPGPPQRRRPQNAPPSAEAGGRGVGPGSRSQSVSSKWGERAVASLIASLHRSR